MSASRANTREQRSPWTAVVLGLLLGQLGYAYTRQSSRMVVSFLLGTLAISLSFGVSLHQFPDMFNSTVLLDDPEGWERKLVASLAVPSIVATLNNVVCAVDLYFQAIALNQRSQAAPLPPPTSP